MSYADKHRKELNLEVGDFVFLKVSPMKGIQRFGVHGKLAPRFMRPFEIEKKIGNVAYKVKLPPHLSEVHDVFHISNLRRYVPDPRHIIQLEDLVIEPDLSFPE